ncbi:MAG: ferritin [Synechococcaceae cyanobacterium]|nr:ferritin [Synechococcaceae cyanobacterium]
MTTLPTFAPSLSLQSGPAGRAVAQPMDAALLDGLQQHLSMERQAQAAYFAIAIWFAERDLRGFSQFFMAESAEEQTHAARFADYLIARGQSVQLQGLEAPRQSWSSPEEILELTFQMEADVTTSLQQLYGLAERCADVRTTTFLDPIVENQLASENTLAHLLGRVRFAQNQPAALLILDAEMAAGRQDPAPLA